MHPDTTGGEFVRFTVSDTGRGMAPEVRDRIFEPYIRGPRASTTRPGIGLGLATVKRLVIAHGGTLGTRRSTLGGAQFWFEFPRVETSERPAASTDSVMRS